MVKENLDLILVAIIVLALVMYDVTIDWVLSVLHVLFELILLSYEWLELGIEHGVEHLFHTSHHISQMVTFYILVLIACGLIYWLWRILPRLFKKMRQFAHDAWLRRKTELELYWLSLSLHKKIMLLTTAVGVAYIASFFVM